MTDYLDDIVAYKRAHRLPPAPDLERAAADAPPVRSFLAAVGTYRAVVMAECKKASPSKGMLAPHYDPVALAQMYADNGAAAVSVLTDEHFFGGSLDDLKAVRAAIDLPLLRKDFTLDERDLLEARAAGADLVLLIARILPNPHLAELVAAAEALGLEPIVEVHDEGEVQRALEAMAPMVGINNRDLTTFRTDLATSERLLASIPNGVVAISESGIRSGADVRRLHVAGAHGMLVGEALITAPDPVALLHELVDAGCPDCACPSTAEAQRHREPQSFSAESQAIGTIMIDTGVAARSERDVEDTQSLPHNSERRTQNSLPPGRFGPYGGRFVPETLMPCLDELEAAYREAMADADFVARLRGLEQRYVGRPTPLYPAENLSLRLGARIYLKREDLAHTGAHKINNALGQGLLAERMGKRRIIAETGAGQHGVATATVCAKLGMECVVYMGEEDVRRQALNVFRMKLLGAEVRHVTTGTATLKDAVNETIRDWVTNVADTHYIIGSCVGPHPYPTIVRDFQSVIGRETRAQMLAVEGRLPDMVIACVGGGSNAIGMFYPFVDDTDVALVGVEAAGEGISSGRHAATLVAGTAGVLHGASSYVLQDAHGQIMGTHSISAGLDYPGVGPEHSYLKDIGRARYIAVNDGQALAGFQLLCATEGIIPALESAHAIAALERIVSDVQAGGPADPLIVVNLSGRGDKDIDTVAGVLEVGL